MAEDIDSSVNIEWKQDKNGEKNSRISRRIDEKMSDLFNQKAPNRLDVGLRNLKNTPTGVKKIRSKIREVFDDEEDEDEGNIVEGKIFNFDNEADNGNSSLLQGLKEEEKQKLQVEETVRNQSLQQNAGKMTAILEADKLVKQSGLKKIKKKIVNQSMINVATDSATFNNTLMEQLAKKEKIKTPKTATYNSSADLVKGLGKIKKAEKMKDIDEKKSSKLSAEELIEIGKETSDEKAAKTILQKTGRDEGKKTSLTNKQEKINAQKKIKETLKQKSLADKERSRS